MFIFSLSTYAVGWRLRRHRQLAEALMKEAHGSSLLPGACPQNVPQGHVGPPHGSHTEDAHWTSAARARLSWALCLKHVLTPHSMALHVQHVLEVLYRWKTWEFWEHNCKYGSGYMVQRVKPPHGTSASHIGVAGGSSGCLALLVQLLFPSLCCYVFQINKYFYTGKKEV